MKGYSSNALVEYLSEHVSSYPELEPRARFQYAKMVQEIYFTLPAKKVTNGMGGWIIPGSKRSHTRIGTDYSKNGPSAWATFTHKELERRFGRGGFQKANDIVSGIEVYDDYKKHLYTKGYRLTKRFKDLVRKFTECLPEDSGPFDLVNNKGEKITRIRQKSAIYGKDKRGRNSKNRSKIPLYIPVNTSAIEQALRTVCYFKNRGENESKVILPEGMEFLKNLSPEGFERFYSDCIDIYTGSLNRIKPGYLIQPYEESDSGRLYGQGTHLQRVKKELRYIALSGQGLAEYDIANCHYSIISQTLAKNGKRAKYINHYVNNKKQTREELAEIAFPEHDEYATPFTEDQRINAVKSALLALIYGANPDPNFGSSLISLLSFDDVQQTGRGIGRKRLKRLLTSPIFEGIKNEIREGQDNLIQSAEVKPGGRSGKLYMNMMGKGIPFKPQEGVSEREHRRKVLAHLAQGIEARMLKTVTELHADKLRVLIHDGWIAESSIKTEQIQEQIESETGYRVRINKQPIDDNYS